MPVGQYPSLHWQFGPETGLALGVEELLRADEVLGAAEVPITGGVLA